jgi:hypothetical protein
LRPGRLSIAISRYDLPEMRTLVEDLRRFMTLSVDWLRLYQPDGKHGHRRR